MTSRLNGYQMPYARTIGHAPNPWSSPHGRNSFLTLFHKMPSYPSLEHALRDAVRIRNLAVHRRLCDTVELRLMALQAQDLMSMFSDVTRQSKFQRLEAELNDWDAASQDGQEGKSNKLLAGLQEISERPLDDMDWIPNAASLGEIKPEILETKDFYIDEMELD